MPECAICSAAGMETPATRHALGKDFCDACYDSYSTYLQPGERLEDLTREELERRLHGPDPYEPA